MGALLDREHAVGERLLDGEGRGLDAGLLGVGDVVDLRRVAVPLGPAQVHPQQHRREVGGIDPAGLRPHGDQRVALVVLPRQQGADLQRLDLALQRLQLALGLGQGARVVLLLAEFDQHREIVDAPPEPGQAVDFGLQPGQLRGDGLRIVLVVPQARGGRLDLEFGDLDPFAGRVEDALDRAQRPVERGQVGEKICGSHNRAVYRPPRRRTVPRWASPKGGH